MCTSNLRLRRPSIVAVPNNKTRTFLIGYAIVMNDFSSFLMRIQIVRSRAPPLGAVRSVAVQKGNVNSTVYLCVSEGRINRSATTLADLIVRQFPSGYQRTQLQVE